MGALLALAARAIDPASMRILPAAVALAALILGATGVYWGCAHLLGAPEPAELREIARRRGSKDARTGSNGSP